MVLGRKVVVDGQPTIRPGIMEKEQWMAVAPTQQANFPATHGENVVSTSHLKTPKP
jgi:hypothetical protein